MTALERLKRVKTVDEDTGAETRAPKTMTALERLKAYQPGPSAVQNERKAETRGASQPSAQQTGQGYVPAIGGPTRQQVAAGRAVRRTEEKTSFVDRAGNVVSGAAKSTGAGYANTGGMIVEGLGRLNTAIENNQNKGEARKLQEDNARYQAMLDSGKDLQGNPLTEQNRKIIRNAILRNEKMIRRLPKDTQAQEARTMETAGEAYAAADALAESSAEDVKAAKEGLGTLGQFAVDVGVAGTQMVGDLIPAIATGGSALPAMAVRGFGGAAQEARQEGASYGRQLAYGLGSAAVSVGTEKLASVSGLAQKVAGKTSVGKWLAARLGEKGAASAVKQAVEAMDKTAAGHLALAVFSEGGEEAIEDALNPLLKLIYQSDSSEGAWENIRRSYGENFSPQEVLYDFLVGGALGGLGAAGDVTNRGSQWNAERRAEAKAAPAAEVSLDEARRIANRFGAELQVGALENGASGTYENGVITIAENAANPVRQVLVHELTHHMEASGLYGEFSGRVLSFVAEDMGVDTDAMMRSITEEYRAAGVELDEDAARRELVAKFAEDKLFRDERSIRRLLQTDRNLFQKIYDWIRDAIVKVKGSSEEKFLADAQKLYEKALRNNQGWDALETGQNLFAGERSKTADFAALEQAREMLSRGMDAEAVRRETGWFRGMDGKWRFEIDDSGMVYRRDGDAQLAREPGYQKLQELEKRWDSLTEQERTEYDSLVNEYQGTVWEEKYLLRDFLQHDDLFRAYPYLNRVSLVFDDLDPGQSGYFDGRSNTIVLSNSLRNQPESTLVHEIQHVIQKVEGFSRGSSPEYWNRRMEEGYSRHRNDGRIEQAEKEYRRIFESAPEEFRRKVREINRSRLNRDYETAEAIVDELYAGEYADLWSQLDMADFERRGERGEEMMPSDLYRNTAGEIEARDAAARRGLTAEQRMAAAPNLGNENTVFAEGSGKGYAIGRTTENRPFVEVEQDILAGVPKADWVSTVKENLKKKFPNGIIVGNNEIRIDKQSRREMTFSRYMQRLYTSDPQLRADKLRATNNADEILHAATDWVNEGPKHPRKDNIRDFARGEVLLRVGGHDYTADVVVGTRKDGSMLMYDVLNLRPASFTERETNAAITVNPSPGVGRSTASVSKSSVAGSAVSVKGEGRGRVPDITPRLTDEKGRTYEERQNSMGRSFTELVEEQRRAANGAPLLVDEQGQTYEERLAAGEGAPDAQSVENDVRPTGLAEQRAVPGDSSTDGYLDALTESGEPLRDPITPSDRIYEMRLDQLQREEAPPERGGGTRIAKRDLDELTQLLQDTANPVTMAREARFEESAGLVSAETKAAKQTAREKAGEAKSYFLRKMVDAGDSVTRVAKAAGDEYLYPFYNMARSSASAGINMIAGEQTDITGKRVGRSLNEIFQPIRAKGEDYYNRFQTYLFDLHNVDRMSLVQPDSTAKMEAEENLRKFLQENPDVAQMTEARLRKRAEDIDPDVAELARELLRLKREVDKADRLGNKPVFSFEVTAEMSRERAAQLLRENPEFADYQAQVREYIHNLMQYRVDSGLMTQQDMDFLEKYYPNYVPTFRRTEQTPRGRDRRNVRVGKTVGRAEGGNQKLVPLHEALGRQTMSVVREGSKNRFGQRLLETWQRSGTEGKVRKYLLDAKEYDADFSLDTFDGADPTPKRENTFTVYKDGKQWELQVDASMFDAVKALSPDTQESNIVVRGIRAGNNLFKALVTGYNPTFVVRNTVRDLQTAGLYSRDGKAFLKNYPLALQEIRKNGEFWKQYKALGGSFSSVFDYQTGTVREPSGKVAKLAARMEALNMAMEQAPRLAEFMSVVKAGDGSMENLMDAMHAAADVTVNFGRAGTLGKVLNANFVPFLNPGIQGFDKMIRRVTETRGAKQWSSLVVRAAALGIAPTLLNALLYDDDDEWEDLRDSDKDTNYLFKIKDGLWLKIPKGRELSILGMTEERIRDVVNGEDVDWGDFITTVGNQVAPANPLNQNILKAWFDTKLLDPSTPGRTWYGGDIENQRLRNYAPGERYDSSTDVFSKWVGKQLGLSPKKINYLLDQYSGVVGDFLLPLLTPQAERDPFSKAFTVDSVSSNRLSGEFYDTAERLTYAANGGDSGAKAASRFWSKQQQACSVLYAQIREIEESDLSDKEKKQKVRETKAILNGIQKNALATLEIYEKTVEKYLEGGDEEDVDLAYREANRECFGAEYALQTYNKDVYEKAKNAAAGGVSYEDYYTYYFETKGFRSADGVSTATQKMKWLENSDFDDETKAEIYFADLASDSDLTKQAELESSSGITPVEYWEYKVATNGIQADRAKSGKTIPGSKKQKVLAAIDSLDITKEKKTALYYAAGYAESTLTEAPWMGLQVPKLDGGTQNSRKKSSGKNASGGSTQRSGLDKYRLDKYKLGG